MTSKAFENWAKPTRVITFEMIAFPGAWPKADSAKCCIFEALNIVGAAYYGTQWNWQELQAHYRYAEPKQREELRQNVPKRASPPPPEYLARIGGRTLRSVLAEQNDPDRYGHHVRARSAAIERVNQVAEAQAIWETNQAAFARLSTVTEWLAQMCRDGKVLSYFRLQSGGTLTEMMPSDWNVDNALLTFVAAGGYNRWFFNTDPGRQFPVFIFFDRKQVEKIASMLPSAPTTALVADLSLLSPYLQFAVKLALAKRYTHGNMPTKEARKADIEQEWAAGLPDVPKTTNVVNMLASLTGFPNPEAILRGGKGRRKQK